MALRPPTTRDHRVDFLRGLALASIFINHVPGNLYEKLTHKNFGFSDAAEVFVMLAGFASAYAYYARYERGERWDASLKALKRAWMLYMSHIVTTVVAIALFGAVSLYFANPHYLDDMVVYMNVKPLFDDPVRGFIGIATLGHQLGYFNILPMYMGILAMVPVIMLIARQSVVWLLALSLALWLASALFVIDMPNYPLAGGWFFNPFAWQLLFVIGFILGQRQREGKAMPWSWPLFIACCAYLILAYAWLPFDWLINFVETGLPPTVWGFDKTYVAWPRLVHVLALGYVVMMSPLGQWMKQLSPANPFTAMGRHSLPIFCFGSLFSMIGTIIRNEWGGGFTIDTLIVAAGLILMALIARALDGRKPSSPAGRSALEPATSVQ
ncbi:MAG: OpgC family protein [Parvibaculaceae bacterium]